MCILYIHIHINIQESKNDIMFYYRYKNRPHMTFDDVITTPEQEFELINDVYGSHEYSVKYIFILFIKLYQCNFSLNCLYDIKIICKIIRFKDCICYYRPVKFSSLQHLSLYFNGHRDMEQIRIYYIGLRGEWTPAHRHGVTICTCEALPQSSDHPKDFNEISRAIK